MLILDLIPERTSVILDLALRLRLWALAAYGLDGSLATVKSLAARQVQDPGPALFKGKGAFPPLGPLDARSSLA